jgi:hypothetical protein
LDVRSGSAVNVAATLDVPTSVVATLVAGVDCVVSGVDSCLGVVDAGRILGVEVAVVATVVVGVDCVGGASRIILSKPYIEIQITIREAPLINLCFSMRSGLHSIPSVGATIRRSQSVRPLFGPIRLISKFLEPPSEHINSPHP